MAKRKVIPVQAVKAYRDSRGRAPFILDQGSSCFNPGKRKHSTHSTARRF